MATSVASDIQIRLLMTGMPAALSQLNRMTTAVAQSRGAFAQLNQGMFSVVQALGGLASLSPQVRELQRMTTAALAATNALNSLTIAFAGGRGGLRGLGWGTVALLGVILAMESFKLWKLKQAESKAAEDVVAATESQAVALRESIAEAERLNRLTKERAEELRKILDFSDKFHLSGIEGGRDRRKELITNMTRELIDNGAIQETIDDKKLKAEREKIDLLIEENRLRAKISAEQRGGVMDAEAFTALRLRSDIERKLIEQKRELTRQSVAGKGISGIQARKFELEDQTDLLSIAKAENQPAWDELEQRASDFEEHWAAGKEKMMEMAQQIESQLQPAVNALGNSITGLITGTTTWAEALRNIGTTILNQVIQGILKMGVQWVSTHLAMAVAGKSIQATMAAAQAPIALAHAALWATPATLATIASYGGAAAAAPGFIGIAQAAVLAQSLATFAKGGYTGSGGRNEPAGVVHGQEFVVNADAVQRIGVPALTALQEGRTSRGGAQELRVKNIFVWSRHELMNEMMNTPEYERLFVEHMARHVHKFRR